MNLDALLHHYLGTDDPAEASQENSDAAAEQITIDFAIERDPGRRFALWALLHVLGRAPDAEIAFKGSAERAAAHDFARLMRHASEAADPTG